MSSGIPINEAYCCGEKALALAAPLLSIHNMSVALAELAVKVAILA